MLPLGPQAGQWYHISCPNPIFVGHFHQITAESTRVIELLLPRASRLFLAYVVLFDLMFIRLRNKLPQQ